MFELQTDAATEVFWVKSRWLQVCPTSRTIGHRDRELDLVKIYFVAAATTYHPQRRSSHFPTNGVMKRPSNGMRL